MRIEHVGLWVQDLEKMKEFYTKYFMVTCGEKYHNQTTGFKSYFLSFEDGARLEIMTRSDIKDRTASQVFGFAHLAISVGSKEAVDELTQKLVNDNFELMSGPRTIGDGYYESVVADPEKNLIEITI